MRDESSVTAHPQSRGAAGSSGERQGSRRVRAHVQAVPNPNTPAPTSGEVWPAPALALALAPPAMYRAIV